MNIKIQNLKKNSQSWSFMTDRFKPELNFDVNTCKALLLLVIDTLSIQLPNEFN